MSVFSAPDFDQHEEVIFFYEPKLDLRAIIAIHNTNLGPALGGCRLWNYATEQEAVYDVLRLSRGMTYKSAISNLNFGGGKMVVMNDPRGAKLQEMFFAIGDFVESLHGRYITAEDVGVSEKDINLIHQRTQYVVGHSNPSPYTAYGVYQTMCAAHKYRFGSENLSGTRVIVQGLGSVGYNLCERLHADGAKLFVHDIHNDVVEKAQENLGAIPITEAEIYTTEAEVYAPCALGATLNDDTIPVLNVQIICGAANNQLKDHCHGRQLLARNILYAPDYIANAGGLIYVWYERQNKPEQLAYAHIDVMKQTLWEVFDYAKTNNTSTQRAANKVAEARFLNSKQPKGMNL